MPHVSAGPVRKLKFSETSHGSSKGRPKRYLNSTQVPTSTNGPFADEHSHSTYSQPRRALEWSTCLAVR